MDLRFILNESEVVEREFLLIVLGLIIFRSSLRAYSLLDLFFSLCDLLGSLFNRLLYLFDQLFDLGLCFLLYDLLYLLSLNGCGRLYRSLYLSNGL